MNRMLKNNIKKFSKNKYKISNKAKLRFDSQKAILFLLFLIIGLFTLYPLLMIILRSFGFGVNNINFSLSAYKKAFGNSATYLAIWNTFKMAFCVLAFTWTIGGSLALLIEKTDFPYKKLVQSLVFLTFTIPPYILSVSWIEFVGQGGYLNRIYNWIFPTLKYRIETYSLFATAFILSIHLSPLVFWGISNALKKIDSSVENAARTCGSNSMKVLFTIVLPLTIPTLISTGLLVLSKSMANFAVVATLALPIGKEVLTTRLYSAIAQLDLSLVAVISLILIAISTLLFIVTEKLTKKRRYYFSKTSGNSNYLIKLGKYKYLVITIVFFFFIITTIIPLVTIVLSSFLKRWGLKITLNHLTLNNYKIIFFENKIIKMAILNSISYGIIAATMAILVGSIILFICWSEKNKSSKLLNQLAVLPIGFPNIVLAIGAILAWMNRPLKLYGTMWIIIATYFSLFLPIIIKQSKGIVENIDISMDKTAKVMGISFLRRFKDIFFPQIYRVLLSGWLLCFLIALREIPISLLLYANGTETLGVMLYMIQSNSYGLEMTSAIAVIVIIISLIVNLLVRKIGLGEYK